MRTHSLRAVKLGIGLMLLIVQCQAADVAEINGLSVAPFKMSLDVLGPALERTTGHKLMISYAGSGDLMRRLDAGATFDVALVWPP